MKKIILIYLLSTFILGSAAMVLHPKRALWNAPDLAEDEVLLATVENWEDHVIWLDARHSDFYEIDHIPNAISLNMENLEFNIVKLLDVWTPNSKIVIYCDTARCDSSREMALRLNRDFNLSDVYVLHGGWQAWSKR